MFCSKCGSALAAGAGFCSKCGKPMASTADSTEDFADTEAAVDTALWNPNAAANWSLLFSPAFGAFLQMRNWRALGEPQKAAASQAWFYAGLGYLTLAMLSGVSTDSKAIDGTIRALGIGLLIAWYFSSGRVQAKYVKAKFGSDYLHKPWGKVLLLAFGVMFGYFVLAMIVVFMAAAS